MTPAHRPTSRFAFGLTLAFFVAAGCAGRKAAWQKAETSTAAQTDGKSAEAAKLIAQGDEAWAKRTAPEEIRKAIAAWEEAAALTPKDMALLVKLTRAHYFLADGYLRADAKAYLETMDRGVAWGERAILASSPALEQKMAQGAKLHEAVAVVPKSGVPALYWYAAALGKWAKKKSFAVLLGQKDNVRAAMERCLELDPGYYYAGPPRYFGAFYAIAPSFAGGDVEKSRESFEASLAAEPNYVGTKVLWAQELAVKLQDDQTFDLLLQEVLATPDDIIPELRPETMVEKAKAKELIARRDELF